MCARQSVQQVWKLTRTVRIVKEAEAYRGRKLGVLWGYLVRSLAECLCSDGWWGGISSVGRTSQLKTLSFHEGDQKRMAT